MSYMTKSFLLSFYEEVLDFTAAGLGVVMSECTYVAICPWEMEEHEAPPPTEFILTGTSKKRERGFRWN